MWRSSCWLDNWMLQTLVVGWLWTLVISSSYSPSSLPSSIILRLAMEQCLMKDLTGFDDWLQIWLQLLISSKFLDKEMIDKRWISNIIHQIVVDCLKCLVEGSRQQNLLQWPRMNSEAWIKTTAKNKISLLKRWLPRRNLEYILQANYLDAIRVSCCIGSSLSCEFHYVKSQMLWVLKK